MNNLFKLPQKISLAAMIIISLIGCCMEVDISIPSFPSMMDYFGATEAQVQSTLSLNFLAFCLAGLFYGPLSEAWGRRGLMLFGATLFMVAAIGCAMANSIHQLMFWRFIQGLGASSTVVLGFVMIADRYRGSEAANYIGKVNAYITVFMAGAPIIGSFIINHFTWRANFSVIALVASIAWLLLMLQLPETKTTKEPLHLKKILVDYWHVSTHLEFLNYAMMPNLLVTAYLTFVGSAAFYYIDSCQLSYLQYAIQQGLVVGVFSAASFFADKIVRRIGGKNAVKLGILASAVSMMMMAMVAFLFPYQAIGITAAMCIFAFGCAFPLSVTFSQSLEILPDLRGACSSFMMSSRLLFSSIAIALTGLFFDGSMKPVVIVNLILVGVAVILYLTMQKFPHRHSDTSIHNHH